MTSSYSKKQRQFYNILNTEKYGSVLPPKKHLALLKKLNIFLYIFWTVKDIAKNQMDLNLNEWTNAFGMKRAFNSVIFNKVGEK